MGYVSLVAGIAHALVGKRPRLGAAVAIVAMMPAGLWGQSTNWSFPGNGTATVTGVNVGIGAAGPLDKLHVVADGVSNRLFLDSYGVGTPQIVLRRARGSVASPAGTTSGDYLGWLLFRGYGATGYAAVSSAYLGAVATENFSDTAIGSAMTFFSTPNGSTTSAERMRIDQNGNIGIGTTTPGYRLDAVGGFSHFGYNTTGVPPSDNVNGGLVVGWNRGNGSAEVNFYNVFDSFGGGNAKSFVFSQKTGGSTFNDLLTIQGNGFVGIGTTTPQHLLHVAGTIGATQIIVSATGADYVFAPNYRLQPLPEVASYIKTNGHLPGISPAEEVEAQGVNLGDMQSKLLAKVEELTLHMIEEHDRNDRLERQNRELQERIARLETAGVPSQPTPAAR